MLLFVHNNLFCVVAKGIYSTLQLHKKVENFRLSFKKNAYLNWFMDKMNNDIEFWNYKTSGNNLPTSESDFWLYLIHHMLVNYLMYLQNDKPLQQIINLCLFECILQNHQSE